MELASLKAEIIKFSLTGSVRLTSRGSQTFDQEVPASFL